MKILLGIILIFCCAASDLRAETKPADIHTIKIENMLFVPSDISVEAGGLVEWINTDIVPHTVTGLNAQFDSELILPNQKWQITFKNAGKFSYRCKLHPTMSGSVTIK